MIRRHIFKVPPRPVPNLSGPVRTLHDLPEEERREWVRQAMTRLHPHRNAGSGIRSHTDRQVGSADENQTRVE